MPIGGHLDGAQRDTFGDNWRAVVTQPWAEQSQAHAVGTLINLPGLVEQIEQALTTEQGDLSAKDHVQANGYQVVGYMLSGHCGRHGFGAPTLQQVAGS